jgi:oxygen-independent coproporphyrinogen-3 oxidase
MNIPIHPAASLETQAPLGQAPKDVQHYMRAGTLGLPALPPLSLYIHLPWCLKKCPYCDFNSHEHREGGGVRTSPNSAISMR